jgi:NAD(P)-dependent dehydrogenase (short-subunit alcohol dehydrogenase family)
MTSPSDPRHARGGPEDAAGRVALVIGGAGRIGAAVVEALAGRGWSVAIHAYRSLDRARTTAEALAARGLAALAVTANLRDEGTVRALVHRVADHFGRIDALVTCVRTSRPTALADLTADDFRAHYEVNCIGTFVAVQEAGVVMAHQPTGGAIVMLGAAESAAPAAGTIAAAASLGVIPALARGLAVEFAIHNPRVRVNAVLPELECPAEPIAHTVLALIDDESAAGACLQIDSRGLVMPARPPAARS